jgi:hypothetical protein
MATPTFQKGDRVAFKESPEVVEGKMSSCGRATSIGSPGRAG